MWVKNELGIYLPTRQKYRVTENGIVVPITVLDERIMFWNSKYELVVHYDLEKIRKEKRIIFITDGDNECCRFCGTDKTRSKFTEDAHALSEQIGNKCLFLKNECDDCNEFFGRNLEDDFAKFLGPARTFSQIKGKRGIPSYKMMDESFRTDVNKDKTIIQTVSGKNNISLYDDHLDLCLVKDTYTPIAAYKALVFMALSIMPKEEFIKFNDTVKWIREEKHEVSMYDMYVYSSRVVQGFCPGPSPLSIKAWVARRKKDIDDVPYSQFVVEFSNYIFQIAVPCLSEDSNFLYGKTNVMFFPCSYELQNSPYGDIKWSVIDLSGKKKVKGEKFEMTLHFDGIEEIDSLRGVPVRELTRKEGVKSLRYCK